MPSGNYSPLVEFILSSALHPCLKAKRAIAPPAESRLGAGLFLAVTPQHREQIGGIRHNYLFPCGTILRRRHSETATVHNCLVVYGSI